MTYLLGLISTEAYNGHCVLCKDVLSFMFQTFDFQVLCFVSFVVKWRDGEIKRKR